MAAGSQISGEIAAGREVELNGLPAVPVRRDLENRGPGEAVVREEQVFPKRRWRLFRAASGGNHFGGDSRQIAPALALLFAKGERDEGGAWGLDLQAELPGQIVTK